MLKLQTLVIHLYIYIYIYILFGRKQRLKSLTMLYSITKVTGKCTHHRKSPRKALDTLQGMINTQIKITITIVLILYYMILQKSMEYARSIAKVDEKRTLHHKSTWRTIAPLQGIINVY